MGTDMEMEVKEQILICIMHYIKCTIIIMDYNNTIEGDDYAAVTQWHHAHHLKMATHKNVNT